MSRSRKKVSCASDYSRGSTRDYKRYASKVIRKFKYDIPNGKSYKKIYNSWNIHDYKFKSWNPNDSWHEQYKRK